MSSIFHFRWLGSVGACLCAVAACSGNDPKTNAQPNDAGAPSTGGQSGTSGTSGSGGSDVGGMGGDGDEPGGAGAGGSGGGGTGGVPDGSGGAGEGGGAGDPVSVVSAGLPDATLNQDYRFVFEANGGSGEGYVFSIEGGALPRGLAVGEDGTLSGIPLEGGDFELEVSVADSNGATARVTLRLHVRQSRWLAYWNILSGNRTVPRYSAIDLASNGFVRRDLSGNLPTNLDGPDVSPSGFSPDGRFAVYSLFITGNHVGNQYYLVDFDRLADFNWSEKEQPSLQMNDITNELVKMYGVEWSPDSTRFAVTALVEDAAHDLRNPYQFGWFEIDEVLQEGPRADNLKRRTEGAAGAFVDWISLDTITYQTQSADEDGVITPGNMVKSTWEDGEFGAPVDVLNSMATPYGEPFYVYYLNRAARSAIIAQWGSPHCIASAELHHFDSGTSVNLGETPLLPAPELERFAGVFDTSLKIVDAAGQTLADLGTSDCSLVEWSDDGTMLAWVDTMATNIHVAKISQAGQAEVLTGPVIGYTTSADRPQFSPDKRWIAFREDNKALRVARIDEVGIHDAVTINVALAAETDRINAYQFSPNGRAIVYAAPGQIAGLDDLYLVDLSGEVPAQSRRISPDLSGFPSGDALVLPYPSDPEEYWERRFPIWRVWTPDSSKVFFVVRDSGGQAGDALYVVDVLATQPRPVQVDVANCDSSACGTINVLLPQPLR